MAETSTDKVTLYGWPEMNECGQDIYVTEVYAPEIVNTFDDGQVTLRLGVCDGEWFLSLSSARRTLIRRLRPQIQWRKRAIEKAYRTKMFNVKQLDVYG